MEFTLIFFISCIFGLAIFGKLTGKTKATFEQAGYSPYFMLGLAFVELILAVGLFTEYVFYSIIGLLVIMLGAIFTLFRQKAKRKQYILSIIAISLLAVLYSLKYSSIIQII